MDGSMEESQESSRRRPAAPWPYSAREKGSASAPGGERRVGLARAPWSLTKSPSDDAGGSGRCGLGTLPPAHGADVSLLVSRKEVRARPGANVAWA